MMITKKLLLMVLVALFALSITTVQAEDRLELDKANIQGAAELPKVLYIVPWKQAEIGEKPVKVNRIVDEVLAPVDRDVLQRQIRFYNESQEQTPR